MVVASEDKFESILYTIDQMSVDEAREFKEKVKQRFGVSYPQTSQAVQKEAEEVEEKTEFQIVLTSAGEKKLEVLKVIRDLFGYGLKEAKEATEALPHTFEKGPYQKEDAESKKAKLTQAGAQINLD